MSAQSSYLNKKGLTVKDLVTIGIFTALFFVFELIGSLPFAPNPALTFYQPFGIAEADACRIEHIISDESFSRLKEAAAQEQE